MATGHRDRTAKRFDLKLSPQYEQALKKMGFGKVLRNLRRAARGESDPQSRARVRLCRQLGAKFDSANPKLDSKLVGNVVARLVHTVEYANGLSQRLREITRIKGR